MKKSLKKILVAGAVVASMTLALATSAFAELKVDYADGKVSVTDGLAEQSGQLTVIIIPKGVSDTDIAAENIYYIDQEAKAAGIFQNMGLKAGFADGDYVVKIGGENIAAGGILVAEFTVGGGQVIKYKLGDVNGDDKIATADAGLIMAHVLNVKAITDPAGLVAADVNKDSKIATADAGLIMAHVLNVKAIVE